MASTYTSNGGIELIATGEQSGTWGTTTNTNLQIVDRLTNGVGAISLSGTTHTLTTSDGTLSDGQYSVLVFGGSPSGTNTVTISPNDAQHVYFVKNGSGQSVVLTQGSGGNVTVADGKSVIVYADGAGAGAEVVDITDTFDFQPLTATLTAIGALAVTDGNIIVGDGSTWVAESGATARTSLGLGSIATQAANNVSITGGSITGITDLAVSDGGTGASSFTANNVLLGNGASSFQTVAPGTSGNVLTSNGTTWTSATPAPGYTDSDVDAHLNVSTATTGEILSWTGSDYDWIAAPAALLGDTDSATPFETSLGSGAGAVNTGVRNTFVGYEAGNDNTTGTDNTVVGYQALDANTTGNENTAIGAEALGASTGTQNTAVGYYAGRGITTGATNTAVGRNALGFGTTTGADNIAIGNSSLAFGTSGSRNVAIGQSAMYLSSKSGNNNTAIGYQAGYDLTTGEGNFLAGYASGVDLTTGSNNVAIGNGALDAATTGGRNIAIGQDAMGLGVATATSGDNVAIGYQAGFAVTSGARNIALGGFALDAVATASDNIAIGQNAIGANVTGLRNTAVGGSSLLGATSQSHSDNTAVGFNSGRSISVGGENVFVGVEAGYSNTSGEENTFIGTYSGYGTTTGIENTFIGFYAGVPTTTGSNNTVIGNFAAASSATISNEITLGNSSITNLRVPGVGFQFDTTDGLIVPKTVTAGGTTGAQTINKTAGTVNFAAAATSLVVTNSFVDANSIIIATVGTDDTTMKSVAVVAGAGSFTLYANAAATAETRVNWFVAN